MKIVRISGEELREWRDVKPKLVSEGGTLLREVTEDELRILAELARRVKVARRGVEWQNPEKTKTIRIVPNHDKPGTLSLVSTIDGYKVDNGRANVRSRFFERYGECQLRLPNGLILATIRDPKVRASREAQKAPPPGRCKCRLWGKPHPDRHHQNCEWNEMKPIAAAVAKKKKANEVHGGKVRAFDKPAPVEFEGSFDMVEGEGGKALGSRLQGQKQKAPKGVKLVSPDGCKCQEWPWPKGRTKPEGSAAHHPICEFRDAWEKAEGSRLQALGPDSDSDPKASSLKPSSKSLIDLDTRQVLREASPEEIAEADESGVATVGDKTYGVVDASEVVGAPA